MNWQERAAAIRWNVRPLIDGKHRASTASDLFNKVNPATEKILYQTPVGDSQDIDAAVKIARRRFDDGCWSDMSQTGRAAVLMKFADLIVQRKEELALFDCLEMGKPIQAALHDAENTASSLLRCWASFADKLVGESAPMTASTMLINTYEPRGVVGAIIPWNFPTVNAIYKLGPALAAGNAVVLKPSELSPSSALRLGELALEAGVPEGIVNIVPGLGRTVGMALALHPEVDFLSFTGSTTTGRKVMELCGRSNGKPLLLECGGKSPHVVFDDVENLDAVADAVVQLVVWNQGQVCGAHTRLIAHDSIKSELLDKIVMRACQHHPADPLKEDTTFGPLASPKQRDRVKAYIDDGVRREGVRVALRGPVSETGGCYVAPSVFDCSDSRDPIIQEEIFGPVLCTQGFSTEDEALALANGTDYGLAATVWTRNAGLGRRMARAIKAGAVLIRTSGQEGISSGCTLSYEPQKASGFGTEVGLGGLRAYSSLKLLSFSGG